MNTKEGTGAWIEDSEREKVPRLRDIAQTLVNLSIIKRCDNEEMDAVIMTVSL